MRTKHYLYAICMIIAGLAFTACENDKNEVKMVNATLQFSAPADLQDYNPSIGIQKLVLKNINTGENMNVVEPGDNRAVSANVNITVSVPEGLYTISMEGSLSYELNEETVYTKMRAYKESVTLTESTSNAPLSVEGYVYNDPKESGSFVIAEIFFTGTETPEGRQYNGDKYFRIYNNSGDTLCADGLTIAESEFMTVSKYDYTPDIMNEAFAVDAVYRIPLGGNVRVAPGKSLLLCDNGMDHRTANPNSFDLTKADFEWYDESTNPKVQDIDTDVPNLEKIYAHTLTIWVPHNRGFKSYALARLGDDADHQLTAEQYLQDYKYDYSYNMILSGTVHEMNKTTYKIPNKWILDAVNLSIESQYVWNVTSPALDRGWTYCGKVAMDKTRYGKSVRRKVLSGITLQDTNDSSVDFLPEQIADPYFQFHK